MQSVRRAVYIKDKRAMQISDVLQRKRAKLIAVSPDASFDRVVKIITKHGIGSVGVISQSGGVVGLVTERGLLEAISQNGPNAFGHSAKTLQSVNSIPTCDPSMSVDEALATMTIRRTRYLLVEEHGRITDIVSIGDLVKDRLNDVLLENSVLRDVAISRRYGKLRS